MKRNFAINLEMSEEEILEHFINPKRNNSKEKCKEAYDVFKFLFGMGKKSGTKVVVSAAEIAQEMKLPDSVDIYKELCDDMVYYGIIEQENDNYVIVIDWKSFINRSPLLIDQR